MENLAKRYAPEVLVGSWQLNYEKGVTRCVKASGARRCVLYHPHTRLFDLMKLASSPWEAFSQAIREAAPDVEILTPAPRGAVAL